MPSQQISIASRKNRFLISGQAVEIHARSGLSENPEF
jgi:hypothetical protein